MPAFTQQEMDEVCLYFGHQLAMPVGLDGVALMQALADVESTYGQNAVPKHEKGYDWGGHYADKAQLRAHGAWAACSYGPWQVMWANVIRLLPAPTRPEVFNRDIWACGQAAYLLLSKEIIPRYVTGGMTVQQAINTIADAYNTGNPRDANVPEEYCAKLWLKYQSRLLERRHAAA